MATAVETMHVITKILKKHSEDTGIIGIDNLDDVVRSVVDTSSITEFRKQFIDDVTSIKKYADVKERLKEVCGIILGGEDTGAVISYNAGGSTVTTAESIVPEDGDLSTAILPEPGTTTPITYTGNDGKSFTFNVKWPDSFTAAYNCETKADYGDACGLIGDSRYFTDFSQNGLWGISAEKLTNASSRILKGLNTWWLRESAKLIYDSFGMDLDGKTVVVQLAGGGGFERAAAATSGNSYNGTPSEFIYLSINLPKRKDIDDNANGTGGAPYLDRVIAHELVHGAMEGIGSLKVNTPEFFREGMAEFVIGGDDINAGHTEDIPRLAQNSDTLSKSVVLADGYLNDDAYPAGYMFLRYLCKQTANSVLYFIEDPTQTVDFNGSDTVINNISEGNTINYNTNFARAYSTSDGKDIVISTNNGKTLVIRDVADMTLNFVAAGQTATSYMTSKSGEVGFTDATNFTAIFGANYKNNDVYAGRGGSYLWGGFGGSDNLFGGNGADRFIYLSGGGNDTIHNAESQDSVSLYEMTFDKITSVQFTDNGLYAGFVDGGSLTIEGQPSTFTVANEGKAYTYRADYQNKTWSQV